jgi:hypothetical protein
LLISSLYLGESSSDAVYTLEPSLEKYHRKNSASVTLGTLYLNSSNRKTALCIAGKNRNILGYRTTQPTT